MSGEPSLSNCPDCGQLMSAHNVAGCAMTWTATTPTQPGYYWLRLNAEDDEPVIVQVEHREDFLVVVVGIGDSKASSIDSFRIGNYWEWLGPLRAEAKTCTWTTAEAAQKADADTLPRWRKMDSAPKDGSWIVIRDATGDFLLVQWRAPIEAGQEFWGEIWIDNNGFGFNPGDGDRWTPLPKEEE